MDILVSYIDSLPKELKTQCRFVIVGKNGDTVEFDRETFDGETTKVVQFYNDKF